MSATELDAYLNEAKMLARIDHPNIVRLKRVALNLSNNIGARICRVRVYSHGTRESWNTKGIYEISEAQRRTAAG